MVIGLISIALGMVFAVVAASLYGSDGNHSRELIDQTFWWLVAVGLLSWVVIIFGRCLPCCISRLSRSMRLQARYCHQTCGC